MKVKGYTPSKRTIPHGKLSIRWRKESATYVIYVSGKVFESGFGSDTEAQAYLDDYCKAGE